MLDSQLYRKRLHMYILKSKRPKNDSWGTSTNESRQAIRGTYFCPKFPTTQEAINQF